MDKVIPSVLAAFGFAALIAGASLAPVTAPAAFTVEQKAPIDGRNVTELETRLVQVFDSDRRNRRRIRRNREGRPFQLRRNREIFRDQDVIRERRRRQEDQDRARDAVRRGDVLPLDGIIQGLKGVCPGTFLNAKLMRRGDRFLYRVSILRPSGRRVTMFVDAGSGAILRGRCR